MNISQIVRQALQQHNLEGKMLEHRAAMIWPEVVGPVINRQTVERRVENGVMWARIASAPMRNELMMQRTALVNALNKCLGSDVIKEIRFV